ncbi:MULTISPECIES: type IA DNA topoisomerase [Bacteroides]|jgi:DNA topoisomerase-3|uniref:DNA topoisomerase n=2 Tax=Bacteroides TaxID=816 RepID=A0AAQ0RQR5_9BACE|nr:MULTISPECIES: type IA DNA topoisomerase [Bacteroides]RGT48939.1 type IA DNA topoisomerase [Bacteroides intestinalis]CUP82416.1 DNA topoisomerase III%2C bacteria and conjugative plasmid [Bacteroides uniformis]
MKTILAEKPSVAREIARIVGATEREEGYLKGNGYYVTWAFGHLVQPAMPDGYGIKGFHRDNLPIIPPVFTLVPRQVKGDKGYKPDSGVVAQIKIIAKLFRESERIIVATDAGREGELIFRYLYEYIGCATPFDRLWISSLTDKAIREGLENLKSGAEYDKLYYAAKARSEADWLVGINATQAITVAAGRGTYSLGRVQTPTLAMICERYWENKRFVPEPVFQLHLSTDGADSGAIVKFSSAEKWNEKQPAEAAYGIAKECGEITVIRVERKETVQEAPLLYDLTTLQKEANTKHGFSAEQTLSIAQKLYEAKLITYPRTGSRYISEDVFAEIPTLLLTLKNNPVWGGYLSIMGEPSHRSVDDTKITDHHALLITEVKAQYLGTEERVIYDMIVGRMLEAFGEKCVKDVTTVSAECGGMAFGIKGSVIKQTGWRAVYKQSEESEEVTLPEWKEGDTLIVKGCSLTEGKTKPKPFHTEATLLSAMQTCGKELEDEQMRQSLKECGIGTPATRAAIIETLFKREYMERQKKSLVPTEKGLALYSVVKAMRIADVAMTGEWETTLSKIEEGKMSAETFRKGIEVYTSQITSELLTSEKLFPHNESGCTCPKCKKGMMQFYGKVVRCGNPDCGLPIFRQKAGKTLTDAEITELLTKGQTGVIKGFNSKQGKPFSAAVTFDGDFNTVFVFPETKNNKTNQRKKK